VKSKVKKFGVRSSEFGVKSKVKKFGVRSSEFGVKSKVKKFGVRSSEFGVKMMQSGRRQRWPSSAQARQASAAATTSLEWDIKRRSSKPFP
jgi:hypothetical protein